MLTGSHFYQRKGAKSTLLLSIINVGAGKIYFHLRMMPLR
ncbi:hypothetical protein HMPREF0484_4847 [Klebsiella pneumoniae subsp. rhinoscleromatis ATCC 13884]|nr:hypothetical protein HMPREF0484_4847 [Klebsiella pneumoniae subsp. rhinoscleromatis ATCC 13884]EGF63838.1 hypothetical protein HMPREF9538_01724 [Klebsiella sp. MS 92-3]EOY65335.1 hypothetical protein H253_0614 [Klebsiella pneumoniae KP-7]EOZ65838.1 hypothetical protein H254_0055 [Klebsiella pneumoniae KP-11]EPO13961.1 hypothetical protein H217_0504 [Klebsiella pneumoniae DMC0799]